MRSRFVALILIAGVLTGAGASLFAGPRHPMCAARQHPCATPSTIASCCCGDAAAPHDAGAPAQSRVEIAPAMNAVPAPPPHVAAIPLGCRIVDIHTSPPGLSLLDLPTLFATLLI